MKKRPSEYWQQNCMTGASSIKESELRLRHEIGVTKIMFGRDYPHPEGTWPNTWDWLRDAFVDVPEDEVRLMLGENAVACYGLDRAKLVEIAETIGPRPQDILGRDEVAPPLVDHFAERAGYRRSYEDIDVGAVDALCSKDLADVAAGS